MPGGNRNSGMVTRTGMQMPSAGTTVTRVIRMDTVMMTTMIGVLPGHTVMAEGRMVMRLLGR